MGSSIQVDLEVTVKQATDYGMRFRPWCCAGWRRGSAGDGDVFTGTKRPLLCGMKGGGHSVGFSCDECCHCWPQFTCRSPAGCCHNRITAWKLIKLSFEPMQPWWQSPTLMTPETGGVQQFALKTHIVESWISFDPQICSSNYKFPLLLPFVSYWQTKIIIKDSGAGFCFVDFIKLCRGFAWFFYFNFFYKLGSLQMACNYFLKYHYWLKPLFAPKSHYYDYPLAKIRSI